jgi:hypothetical protein
VYNELQRALACAVAAEPGLMHGVGQVFQEDVLKYTNEVCGARVLALEAGGSMRGNLMSVLDLGAMEWRLVKPEGIENLAEWGGYTGMLRMTTGDVMILATLYSGGGLSFTYSIRDGRIKPMVRTPEDIGFRSYHLANLANGNAVRHTLFGYKPEVYNPLTETWSSSVVTSANQPETYRTGTAVVMISEDTMMIIGGRRRDDVLLNTAELWNPTTYVFTPVLRRMRVARVHHAAVLLPNRQVLVSGGNFSEQPSNRYTRTCELYDVATGRWRSGGDLVHARRDHQMVFLPSLNLALAVGGATDGSGMDAWETGMCELYDPATNGWRRGPTLWGPHWTMSIALCGGGASGGGASAPTPPGEDD